jgi:hypothetical protein
LKFGLADDDDEDDGEDEENIVIATQHPQKIIFLILWLIPTAA